MAAPEIARSPYLSVGHVPARRWTRLRLIWTVAIAFVAALVCLGVATEFFHPDGNGFYLYWLHDNLYLPVKGYFWTRDYPDKLWIWATLLTVLAIWLPFFLMYRSASQTLHRRSLRAILHWTWARKFAGRWIRWVRGTPFRAKFLETFIDNECRRLLAKIDQAPAAAERDLLYFTQLVALRAGLERAGGIERLQAASWLIDAILRLELLADPDQRKAVDVSGLWRLLREAVAVDEVVTAAPEIRDIYRDSPLEPEELERYIAWYIGQAVGAWGPGEELVEPLTRARPVLVRQVIAGLDGLRRILAASREPGRLARRPVGERAYRPESAAMLGRAAGQLALLAAVMERESALAQGYFDSVETARFEILLGGYEQAVAADDPVIALTGDPETPSPGDYGICARLLDLEAAERRSALMRRTDADLKPLADLLEESDLMRVDREVARVRQAAGRDAPDPTQVALPQTRRTGA